VATEREHPWLGAAAGGLVLTYGDRQRRPDALRQVIARHRQRLVEELHVGADAFRQQGIDIPTPVHQYAFEPTILPGAQVATLERDYRAIMRQLDALFADRFGADLGYACDVLKPPLGYLEAALVTAHRPLDLWGGGAPIARPDVVLTPDGPRFVELNATPSVGLYPESGLLEQTLWSVPEVAAWLSRIGCNRPNTESLLLDTLQSVWGTGHGLIAIVDWSWYLESFGYVFEYLARALRDRGVQCVITSVESLQVTQRGLSVAGRPIGGVYGFFHAPERDEHGETQLYQDVLECLYRCRVSTVGHLGHRIMSSKALLAMLSDPDEAPRSGPPLPCIPWTRLVADRSTLLPGGDRRAGLLDIIAANPDRYVLKSAWGCGGRQVVVGKAVTPSQWRTSIARALDDEQDWVVQEWVAAPAVTLTPVDSPVSADYGFYLFRGHYAGGLRRSTNAVTRHMTHVTSGAHLGAVFVRR
jgi:hypothetical protein